MIIARLHRGGLAESMETAKTFETLDEMKEWFSEQYHKAFSPEDVVVKEDSWFDERIGWNYQHVCTNRYGNEDFISKHGSPQCIGMCDLNYQID